MGEYCEIHAILEKIKDRNTKIAKTSNAFPVRSQRTNGNIPLIIRL